MGLKSEISGKVRGVPNKINQVSLLGCCKRAEHKFAQFSSSTFEKGLFHQNTTLLHIPAKSRRNSDVLVFWGLRKFAPMCFCFGWGLRWWVVFLFLAAYLHDGWRRDLDHNNQERQRIRNLIKQRTTKHQTS